MALFERFASLTQTVKDIGDAGQNPFGIRFERVLSPTEALIDGREVVLVGTNNYLGLTFDPDCIEAGANSIRADGTGTTGSRIANGTYGLHADLERDLADFFGLDHAMVFTTGFQANLGVLSAVAGPDDILMIDSDSHASVYDACKLSSAEVLRFRHNDPADLDHRLARLKDRVKGDVFVVVEGIYSMLGDTAPLRELVKVKKKHGAYMIVDEAHSLGVLGERGCGLTEAEGLLDDVEFLVGTFSKSLGAIGGFCASSVPNFDIMRVASRPYMFSASLPPSVIATVRTALAKLRATPELRLRLARNIDTLYDGLARAGFRVGPEKSPIIAVEAPSKELAVHTWGQLLDAGYYVNLALSPATPGGISLLRCSVSAGHTPEQLEGLVNAMTEIGYANGMLQRPVAAMAE